jgi:hypothetical protein
VPVFPPQLFRDNPEIVKVGDRVGLPDNMRYDEASKMVFVGFGQDDGGIAMIDPKKASTDETPIGVTPSSLL